MTDRERSIHLSPVQVVAGALASVTAAVLASFFGVAGTVIGAGVMSAAASIGNAVYSYWLRSTHRAIRETIPSAFKQQASTVRTLVGSGARASSGSGAAGAGSDADSTNEVPALDASVDVPPPPPTSLGRPPTALPPPPTPGRPEGRDERAWIDGLWPSVLKLARSLRWRNIVVATAVVFVVSMGVVTAVEALAKKPLSAIVSGSNPAGATTSLGGIVGGGQSSKTTPTSPSTPTEPTMTTPSTTAPNSSSTTTTSPSSPSSTTPGRSPATTSPTPTSPSTTPGSSGTSSGSAGSSNGVTSSGSSSGASGSATGSRTSASGASSAGTPSAGG